MEKIAIKLDNYEDATNKFNELVLSDELASYIEESSKHT